MSDEKRYHVSSKIISMLTEYWRLKNREGSKKEEHKIWELQTKIMNKLFFNRD